MAPSVVSLRVCVVSAIPLFSPLPENITKGQVIIINLCKEGKETVLKL